MTRGEAVAVMVASMAVLLAAGLSALGWYINRRVAAWTSVLSRLSSVEGKVSLIDASGTHRNTEGLALIRRDLERLEQLHRRDLVDVDRRIASATLSQAQLAERLNAYTWGRRAGDPHEGQSGGP